MKKQLLTLLSVLSVGAVVAQTPSPSLNINQNANYTLPTNSAAIVPGVRFIDAVDQNVVWTIGYDAAAPGRNYNWWSKSVNGGTSFNSGNVYADTNTYDMANMEGIDANTAWVSAFMKSSQSQGAIHRTTNGGATWQNMTAAGMYTNTASFCNIVSFFTPSLGITQGDPINGEFEIWRTTDGGLSWTQIPGANIPNPGNGEFAIVDLYSRLGSNNLWFGTNQGRIFRTNDGGLTWNAAVVGVNTNTLLEIAFTTANNGLVTLATTGNNLEMWNTTDGGITWTQITTIDPNFGQNDFCAVPGTGMYVSVGNQQNIVSSSTDNGVTWTDWGSTGIGYISCDFASGTVGWVGNYNTTNFTNVWKYSGAALQGTTAPTAAFQIPSNICLSGGSAVVTVTNNANGNPTPTFSWTVLPAGATLSNATASVPVITFNSANTYTVILVASNANGTVTAQQVVNVISCQAPTATFTLPANGCTNFTFAANNSSTGSPAPSTLWSISPSVNTTVTPSAISSSPVFKTSTAGVYTITLLTSNASGTATATQTINVTACPPAVSFSIPASIRFCDVKTFSTTNQTTNPPGTSGTISYTWNVSPNVGLSFFPNRFQQNMSVTISDPTILGYTVTLLARNASGTLTTAQSIVVDDCTTGINENALGNAMDIYPNPARDIVTIAVPAGDTYSVKVTNLLGAVVYTETINKEKSNINLANVARGVYFITVESKTEKATRKVVLD